MKAWFKTHAALERMLTKPGYALSLARGLATVKFRDGQPANIFATPEAQVMAWEGYLRDMWDAHVFEFDDDTALLMTLTDNEPHDIKLPFPVVWLDVEFDLPFVDAGVEHVQGILLYDSGLPIMEDGTLIRSVVDGIVPATMFLETRHNKGVIEVVHGVGPDLQEAFKKVTGKGLALTKLGRKEQRAVSSFIMNFLDLLETPDVMIVPVKRKRLLKRNYTHDPPIAEKVVLRASVRRYVDQLKASGQFHYSHRFWVRGHWRHYRSDRYKNVQGEKEWIKPFIKGEGILVKKQYRLPTDKRVPEEL